MTSSGWSEVALGDVADVSWGNTSTTKKAYVDAGFRAYSASGPDGFVDWAEHHDPGVVLSAIGAQCGKTWWAEGSWTCIKNTIWFRSRSSEVESRFLFYATSDPGIWPKRGAAQPFISQGDARALRLRLPSLSVQRRVVDVLSAIDDLMENNGRRIGILEEMARLIYREWFVHFRFPGYEEVELVDSDLGPVPEGWEARPIGQVIQTVGGGTPSKEKPEYWLEPSINWYTPSDLTKRSAMFAFGSGDQINELGLSKSSATLFPPRTLMMTSRATIGEIAIATTEASTNQGFISCVPNERLSEYHLYFWLQENVDLFHTLAGGATFKELRKSTFRDLPIVVPPIRQEAELNETIGPMCDLIERLLRQNGLLREARGKLLPRLISGELDVSDLELVA